MNDAYREEDRAGYQEAVQVLAKTGVKVLAPTREERQNHH